MAISPPSDIVMDVMRAADPMRVRQATRALTSGQAMADVKATNVNSPTGTADAGSFVARLASAEKAPARAAAGRTGAGVRSHDTAMQATRGPVNLLTGPDVPSRAAANGGAGGAKRALPMDMPSLRIRKAVPDTADDGRKAALHAVYAGLESLLLQQMLEAALAAGGSGRASYFGRGLAGQTWRSLMVAGIADTVGATGGLGLADRLMADPARFRGLVGTLRG